MMPMLSALEEVVDGIDNREHQGFLEAQEAHPLLRVRVLMEEVIKALYT